MIELKKDDLLFYFPYTAKDSNNVVQENKSIYDVIKQIEAILWKELSTGSSERPADVELKLIDYQADVAKRKKDFEKMREELSDKEKERAEQYQQAHQAILNRYVPKKMQGAQGNIPFSVAEDPEAFEKEYKELHEETYKDLMEREKEIEENFQRKMEGISKVKLAGTESFTRGEVQHMKGQLVKAVRPLLEVKAGEPSKNGKAKKAETLDK